MTYIACNLPNSYDALPNFTAADCLRLLGIGRNQYIDLMNQCRYQFTILVPIILDACSHLAPVRRL